MSRAAYRTFDVTYERSDDDGANRVVDRAVIVAYGSGELVLKRAIEQERPAHRNVVILASSVLR